jgi:sucrose-6-phosphate hydrolase SacC (GH32 family)
LFECPELYELPVQGDPSQKKWVIAGANGLYAIGSFDGKSFTIETERLQGIHGRDFYAAQTFNNEPGQRIIEMGWWRTKTNIEGMPFNQSQSIPMEIKLVNTEAGLRIARFPVKELGSLRKQKHVLGRFALSSQKPADFSSLKLNEFEMRLQLEPGKAKQIQWNIHGRQITYDVQKQQLICDGVTAPAPLVRGKLELVIYVDRIGFEIFTADGLLFMPVNINIDITNPVLSIISMDGKTRIHYMDIYELNSCW